MSKKYQELAKLVDRRKLYSLKDAIKLLKQTTRPKFVESVDLAIKLGIDPKKNTVRGTVVLPAGSGKSMKVAVLTKGQKVKEAEEAGADHVGAEELVEKISGGFMDFDVLIASPDMMGSVGKLGKVLGSKGLMPNPKSGTVTVDIGKTVKEFKSGKVEFKVDKTAVIHMLLGKSSFKEEELEQNFLKSFSAIVHARPSGFEGNFVQSITLSNTMGPGIKLDPKAAQELAG